ncbi:MAG: hypothetical protein KJ957_05615 [Candidatus Omnitrophica bacterium]|nr:hypothetical protein [Candidatus Omnitrophota bacterium]
MNLNIDFDALKASCIPYLKDLRDFQFSFLNPLFWVGLLILFFILLRFWQTKKAFSFCLIIGAILLASTKLEGFIEKAIAGVGGTFDPLLVRIGVIFVVSVIFLYYLIVRDG